MDLADTRRHTVGCRIKDSSQIDPIFLPFPIVIVDLMHDAVRFNTQGKNVHPVPVPRRHRWSALYETAEIFIVVPFGFLGLVYLVEVQVHSANEAVEHRFCSRRTSYGAEQTPAQVFVCSPLTIDRSNVIALVGRSS